VYALNVMGCLKSPNDFYDITSSKSLRQVSPKNIIGGDPADKRNPRPGYTTFFPRVVAHWKSHEALLATICEYHDVSKHRCAVATGGDVGALHLADDPKQLILAKSSEFHTIESLGNAFQGFIDALLPIALEECASLFGFIVERIPSTE
jgi:hypothetical protein